MQSIGLFLEAWWNKVFFVNWVLEVFNQNNISVDHIYALSSSSAILFAHLHSCHQTAFEIFYEQIKSNKKNFYLFSQNKFPHNKIYKSSIQKMFLSYNKEISHNYTIVASYTQKSREKFKARVSTLFLMTGLFRKSEIVRKFRELLWLETLLVSNLDNLSKESLIDIIMWTSTIYPFINLHYFQDKVILEGALSNDKFEEFRQNHTKNIVIHTKFGKTEVVGNVLHIYYPSKSIWNILDYTNEESIATYYKAWQQEAQAHIELIKKFTDNKRQ